MNNKKKMFFAVIGTSMFAVALSVGFLANNANRNLLDANAANVQSEGLFTQATQGAHLAGNAVYFVDCSSDQWWCKEGAKTAFYFFRQDSQDNTKKIEAFTPTVVSTWERNSQDVYESIVPAIPSNEYGFTTWEKVIAVRIDPSVETGTVPTWSNQYKGNQSSDQTIGSSGYNAVFLGGDGGYSINALTAAERLEILSWSQNWSKPSNGTSDYCDDNGNTDTSTLHDQWEASKTSFNKLGADVKYAMSSATAVPDTEHSGIARLGDFAARYDLVYFKYSVSCSLTNWADRTINL